VLNVPHSSMLVLTPPASLGKQRESALLGFDGFLKISAGLVQNVKSMG